MGRKYSAEQLAFLREFAPGHWLEEITDSFNAAFGLSLKPCTVRSLMNNHRIASGVKHTRWREKVHLLTTPEQDELVRQRYHDRGKGSFKEVQEYLVTLGVSMTLEQVKGYLSRKHIRLGVYGYFKPGGTPANKGKKMSAAAYARCKPTMFHKGFVPHNTQPVGSESIGPDGYTKVKVAQPSKWMLKHRYLWEQATGEKLQKGDRIIFLDGNRQNITAENLAKVSGSQLARLNQNHLLYSDAELSKTGVLMAKLLEAKAKAEKRKQ